MTLAKRQAATALVFVGLIASNRGDADAARAAWADALEQRADDPEAFLGMGQLAWSAGRYPEALDCLDKALAAAADDRPLISEVSYLRADIYGRRGNPLLERDALKICAPIFAERGEYKRAGATYARLGEVESSQGFGIQAPHSYRNAFDNYHRALDGDGMNEVRQRLSDLGEDVSLLPTLAPPSTWSVPWFWVRLAIELSMLATAASLLFIPR